MHFSHSFPAIRSFLCRLNLHRPLGLLGFQSALRWFPAFSTAAPDSASAREGEGRGRGRGAGRRAKGGTELLRDHHPTRWSHQKGVGRLSLLRQIRHRQIRPRRVDGSGGGGATRSRLASTLRRLNAYALLFATPSSPPPLCLRTQGSSQAPGVTAAALLKSL